MLGCDRGALRLGLTTNYIHIHMLGIHIIESFLFNESDWGCLLCDVMVVVGTDSP